MPLDKSLLNGSDSCAGSSSGESDDEGNCSARQADPNATDAESGDDGTGAQKFDEQSDNGSDISSEHTPAQKSKQAPFTQRRDYDSDIPDLVDESSDEECADATDEETASFRVRKSGFTRPRLQWQVVQTWNRDHVSQRDYEAEVARILARSLQDAKYEVTPKFNARAISDWRYKTVSRV
jgi:phage baseplate assembly protein W